MAPTSTTEVEVELDSRQRLPLARIVKSNQHRFRVTPLPSGEYVLTPVVSVSERELALLKNPEAVARLNRGIEQAESGDIDRLEPGHYERLVAELGPEDED